MKKLLTISCGIVIALVAGCSGPASDGESRPRVALIMKSLANEFFQTMEQGARDFHADNPDTFDLIVNGIPNEEDIGQQVALVEQMMAQGVDAIVIAPADSKALVSVLQRAADSGIAIVNIDNKLDAEVLADRGVKIPFVGPDNKAGAKLAGDYVASQLSAGAEVAIVGGIPTAFNAIQRHEGFEAAMKEAGMKIVSSQSGHWEMSKAHQVSSGMLNEHPDLAAILCANDSMALGAVAALRDAGREDDVKVVGYDNISAVQDLIRDGSVLCTVDQYGDQLAVFGIQFALEMLASDSVPDDRATSVDLVTAETLAAARQ